MRELLWILVAFTSVAHALRVCDFVTCRHTYETTLMEELRVTTGLQATTVAPGLLLIEDDVTDPKRELPPLTYALQWLPSATHISGSSITKLAKAAMNAIEKDLPNLDGLPRGSLAIHALTPDVFRGAKSPALLSRAEAIASAVSKGLRGTCPAARPRREGDPEPGPRLYLLQLLLLDSNTLAVSLSASRPVDLSGTSLLGHWPCWSHPAGIAQCSIGEYMPSSAYRKLAEGLQVLGLQRLDGWKCVDLGACPGGWTALLRRLGAKVIAVDRSELDSALWGGIPENLADFKKRSSVLGFPVADPGSEDLVFVQGDAFAWSPPEPVDLMVSDVASYPERVAELLERWCSQGWADNICVTVKFQGEPSWQALEAAKATAAKHGFVSRSLHLFSNKNECTLLVVKSSS